MATDVTWMQLKDQGSNFFQKQEWTEAMNCYTSAIGLKPDEAILYSNRAICANKLKKFQQAREDAEFALRIDPKNIKFYRILSESLMGLQLFKEALKECEKGLHLDPKESSLLSRQQECRSKLTGKTRAKKADSQKPPKKMFDACCSGHNTCGEKLNCGRPEPTPDEIEEVTPWDLMQYGFFLGAGDVRMKMPIRQPDMALKLFQMAEEKGSVAALYYIGMMHFKGQAGLKKDPVKAIKLWRRVAAEKPFRRTNGEIKSNIAVSDAENAIGDAFRHGIGVKQDDVEAYNWYERSGKHGSPSGMINFASFKAAGRGGPKEPLFARILLRRASRMLYGDEETDEREDVSEDGTAVHFNVFAKLSLFRSPVKAKRELQNKKVMAQMMEKRLQGWPTAKSYFQAYDAMNEANEMLADEKYHESFKKLREIWRTWDFAFTDYRPFLLAARRVLKSNPEDHGALYVIAIAAPEDDFKEKLKLILKCLQLDPSVPDYHLMAAHLYAMNDDFEIALKFCDKALELLPHPSWLFTRAHLLQLVGPKKFSVKKMIEAFQLYLSSVPSDYSDVAEAYYSIAWLLGYHEGDDKRPISALEKTVFDMGRNAENVRLPCFRPVELYGAEVYLSQNMMAEHSKNLMAGKETESKLVELLCACCTKTESLSSCITCKKSYYCSEKCRKNNAIVHNISCNK